MPVLIAGVAEVLVSELEMNRGAALLSVGLATMAIAGLSIAVGRHWLRKKLFGFPLASEEFTRNVNWVRTVLRQSGRWPKHR